MSQNGQSVFDHFGTLCIKGLMSEFNSNINHRFSDFGEK